MGAVVDQLRVSQSLADHRRLVALVARLAGLRGWGCFDLDHHAAAERWYTLALTAARESEAWALCGWLLGAQSLIPWHRNDHRGAQALIEQGLYLAGQGGDSTAIAWLHALHGRTRAAARDREGFTTAYGHAERAADYSTERDRRHGMDFDRGVLDLRYYTGLSHLLLGQPVKAADALQRSLAALPPAHTKARAVLTLAVADANVQAGDTDHAIELARTALSATLQQPIMPILQQARRIRRRIGHHAPPSVADLDHDLEVFAAALAAAAGRAES